MFKLINKNYSIGNNIYLYCADFYLHEWFGEYKEYYMYTDKKGAWNAPNKSAMQKYHMKPLLEHDWFLDKKMKNDKGKTNKLTNYGKSTSSEKETDDDLKKISWNFI